MKRPCSALTLLLAALAGSLLAADAKCQTGYEHGCPFADGEASRPSVCPGDDACWQTHQALEPDYNYRSEYDAGYDDQVYGADSAQTADAPQTEDMPQTEDATLVNEAPQTEDLQYSEDASNESDPSWMPESNATEDVDSYDSYETQGYDALPQEETNAVADPVTPVEDDNSWNQTQVGGNESAEISEEDLFHNESPSESATIDPQWAEDAVNSVESWIERLTPRSEEPAVEAAESDIAADEHQTPENVVRCPQESADPTYGAHLWDDCDMESNHWECERPTPIASNERDEEAMSPDQAARESRNLLLHVAHSLNEAGLALQTASKSLANFASEGISTDSSAADGIDEYRD